MTAIAKTRPAKAAANSKDVSQEPLTRSPTKTDRLVAMLKTHEGVSIEELSSTFGWLKHTTRAAMTGLRKKGHAIVRSRGGSGNVYRIKA